MTGSENWVQKLLNDQIDGQVVQQFKSSHQFQTQIMKERGNSLLEPIERGNPLLELTRESCKMEEKRPVLRRSKHVLFKKKLSKPMEQGNPLLKQVEPNTFI